MKPIIVKVTSVDILYGNAKEARLCPIALALKRVVKKPVSVGDIVITIGSYQIIGSRLCGTTKYKAPTAVTRFVHAFDDGKPVKPFTFRLTKRNLDATN
jgi:hypothetical protein